MILSIKTDNKENIVNQTCVVCVSCIYGSLRGSDGLSFLTTYCYFEEVESFPRPFPLKGDGFYRPSL